jgi:hypothetical protein
MRLLKDTYRNLEFWEVKQDRHLVLPFPGKFPTRWRITFTEGLSSKLCFDRITKPDPLLIGKVMQMAKRQGYISFWEFDRGGPFRYGQRACPRRDFNVSKLAMVVGSFYYPWHGWAGDFFDPWRYPMFHKQMKFGLHNFFIYSPYERMFYGSSNERSPDADVAGLSKVAAKNKSVEMIDLGKLPKIPAPILLQQHCADCGYHFSKREQYKNLIIRCPNCGRVMYCR